MIKLKYILIIGVSFVLIGDLIHLNVQQGKMESEIKNQKTIILKQSLFIATQQSFLIAIAKRLKINREELEVIKEQEKQIQDNKFTQKFNELQKNMGGLSRD